MKLRIKLWYRLGGWLSMVWYNRAQDHVYASIYTYLGSNDNRWLLSKRLCVLSSALKNNSS